MNHIKKFNQFDVVNEEENWFKKGLTGLALLLSIWSGKAATDSESYDKGKDKKMHHTLDLAKVAANSKNPTETLKHLSKHNSGRVSKPYNRSKRAQAGGHQEEEEEQQGGYQQEEEEEQQGGRAVSLKTAVRLLRQYYNSKYN